MFQRLWCRLFGHAWVTFDVLAIDQQHYVGQMSSCLFCPERKWISA